MRNIKLVIEYDGSGYVGWQVQPNGASIQQMIEQALEKLLGEFVRIHSSGRTDAGVHAHGMVACFRTDRGFPLRAFTAGLNSLLPPDIAVKEADDVPLEFNPRADAIGKHYRYTLYLGKYRSPLARLYSWHLHGPVDLGAMREAASHFVGEHDFAAFRAAGCVAKTTVRTVTAVEIVQVDEFVHIEVYGTGFLRNMVRVMTGTLVEVGLGRREVNNVKALLETRDRPSAGITAPPQGLCLMSVFY